MRKKTATLAQSAPSNPASVTKPIIAAADAKPSPNGKPLSEEAIRLCAYGRWEAAGKPSGDGVRFWLDAEKDLSQSKKPIEK